MQKKFLTCEKKFYKNGCKNFEGIKTFSQILFLVILEPFWKVFFGKRFHFKI